MFRALWKQKSESCMGTGEPIRSLWVSLVSQLGKVCDITRNPEEDRNSGQVLHSALVSIPLFLFCAPASPQSIPLWHLQTLLSPFHPFFLYFSPQPHLKTYQRSQQFTVFSPHAVAFHNPICFSKRHSNWEWKNCTEEGISSGKQFYPDANCHITVWCSATRVFLHSAGMIIFCGDILSWYGFSQVFEFRNALMFPKGETA